MTSKLLAILSLLLALACASNHRETSAKIRQLVVANQHEEAIVLLKESQLATDKNSQLLYFIELGLLEHYKGNYPASIEALNSAKTISDELYTTRVSGKLKSIVGSDNADYFYGEKYEASLIYFYLSLNHYMQSEQETDPAKKKVSLLQARSEILAWDSFLTEIKNERMGKALFKEDLLAKIFGALIHEAQGTQQDDQIALQLYRDASDVLFKNYNLFPTFNSSYKSFRENFEKLPKMPLKEVEGKYVLATHHNSTLKEFLKSKILFLTKKDKSNGHVTFLIQDGLIAEKMARKYEIPVVWPAGHSSFAFMFGMGSRVSFELPAVEPSPKLESARLQAIRKDGTIAAESSLSVISPLGELAEQAINEHSASIAAKTATRVIAKHVAALVATSAAYHSNSRKNAPIALMVATVAHAAAIAGINKSEKADLRFWGTLPSNIRMGHMALPYGDYQFRAVFGEPGAPEYRVIELGEKKVSQGGMKFVMNNKHLKPAPPRALASFTEPVIVKVEVPVEQNSHVLPTPKAGCYKNSECPEGTVCATVKGEFPGSCAETGLFRSFSSTK